MQTPRDIVIYLDSVESHAYAWRVAFAASLAARRSSHLIVAFVPEDIAWDQHVGFARRAAVPSVFEAFDRRRRECEDAIRACLREAAGVAGVVAELRLCEGEVGEALMLHARHASLAILGARRSSDRQVSALTLSEDVIFASGRPSTVLPAKEIAKERLARRLLIGWNASREAARAVADAMPFLVEAEAVHLVIVAERRITRLLGQEPGADIARHLARHGVTVVVDRLDGGDAGELLLSRARQIDADMVVMGAYGQPKITEFIFDSATQRLLTASEIPLFLSR